MMLRSHSKNGIAAEHIQRRSDSPAGLAADDRRALISVNAAVVGNLVLEPLASALGVARLSIGDPAGLLVVGADDYLRESLRAINEKALRAGHPWLLVKPIGSVIWLGPLFIPHRTGCWECLAQRLRANRPVDGLISAKKGGAEAVTLSRAFSSSTLEIGWSLAASDAARWATEGALADREGAILTIDVRSWETRRHVLVRRPQCAACGNGVRSSQARGPIALESKTKVYTHDGGHRAVSPEDTLARYGHHVSPITGAVSMLEPLGTWTDGVVHVYRSHHNVVVNQTTLNGLRAELRGGCAGKGASDLQARASGLCEALERYSSTYTGDEPRRRARLDDLGGAAIHPNRCMLFSDRQYEERESWNERKSHFCRVPKPFDTARAIDWSPVWSLTSREVRYLPTGLCYFGYPCDGDEEYPQSSNGHSAGNTLEEAVLQGLLELVERDSCALWWYHRIERPGVDIESFDHPYVRRVSAFLAARQRRLWVLDLTADLGIPVFAAVSNRVDGGSERLLLGFGAHLDARIALLRAVSELTQMLTWMLRQDGAEQADESDMAPTTAQWLAQATLQGHPHLAPIAGQTRSVQDFPRNFTSDIRDDIEYCQSLLEQRGLELLLLDLTRPDIGLPTVKVIVPGLRPSWARFAPGRLYRVPVDLGWLPEAPSEDRLNPTPMFL